MNLSRAYTLARRSARTASCSRSGACRRRRWRCWSSASSRSAPSCPRTTSRWWPTFRPRGAPADAPSYHGTWFRPTEPGAEPEAQERARRLPAGRRGGGADRRARAHAAARAIESVDAQTRKLAPPPLYDLTELQRARQPALRLQRARGRSSSRRRCTRRKKLLRYPRTDSRHLSQLVAATLPRIVRAIAGAVPRAARARHRRAAARAALRRRRARSPTTTRSSRPAPRPSGPALSRRRGEALRPGLPPAARGLARRPRLRGHHGHHRDRERPRREPIVDRYHSQGSAVVDGGLARARGRGRGRTARRSCPRGLARGQAQDVRRRARPRASGRARRRASPRRRCSPRWRRRAGRSTRRSSPTR